jgi:diacylglycerol kinase (ATP)
MIGFVVNPASGNGRGNKVWHQLEAVLNSRNIPYIVQFTTQQREAELITSNWTKDSEVTIIVAVGGDGTVHEVANGLYQARSSKPLGYIPAGSGNDYARGHLIPLQPLRALEVVLYSRNTRHIDVILMNNQIAVSSIGIGLDGQIARVTNQASYKKLFNQLRLGKLSYVLSLIRVLFTYKTCPVSICIDGTTYQAGKVWLIATANIPYYGGGMQICPQANPTDGQAELCIVSAINRAELLRVFPQVYKGTHVKHKAISFYQGRMIEIEAARPLEIHMDGETAGTTPALLEVLPAALNIIVP